MTQSPRAWAKRWGIAARMTGTPEPSSGQGLMTPEQVQKLFADPKAREALRQVEERVFGCPSTVGVAVRCLEKTAVEKSQERAVAAYKVKRSENLALYNAAEKGQKSKKEGVLV